MYRKVTAILAFVLLAVLALGVAGSGAWFTNEISLKGNLASAGTLKLGATDMANGAKDLTGLEPGGGYVTAGYFTVKNDGSLDMKWRGKLDVIWADGNIADYLQIKVTMNPTDVAGFDGDYGPANTVLFTDVPVKGLENWNDRIVMDDPVWPFKPGNWCGYKVEVKLADGAPNEVQGAVYQANLSLFATQRIATTFAP